MYIKIESCRLKWYSKNQKQIRADLYKEVVDVITSGETRASAIGVRIVLPRTFPGGDRDMKGRHMDAMAIVHTYGKPDIFLTMTCNPNWEEISDELFPGQTVRDRPDLVARVFHGKLEAMKEMLFKKHILGVVVAYVYVVEFQKRGLPHAHFLLIMDSTYKLIVPEQYDRLISAELPDKHKVSFSIDQPDADGNIDEIKRYIDARVALNAQADLTTVLASENASKSMLTEYFKANQDNPWARNILYKDFPGSFTWQKGKTSFEDLLTVDGRLCGSFTESTGSIDDAFDPTGGEAREVIEESNVEFDVNDTKLASSLNLEQRVAYDEILAAVEHSDGVCSFLMAREVLPVARMGSRGQIIDATLRSSHLWKGMRQLRLVTNMRAHNDTWFVDYLLRVGNSTEEVDDQGNIRLPEDICVPSIGEVDDLEKLIDHVFPSLDDNMSDPNYMTSRAILSTTNDNIDKINIHMVDHFRGEEVIYHSFDSAEDDPYGYYPLEFLNGLTPNGLPPHALKLKLNCHVILLRNIDPANGLCNGTRLVVRGFERNAINEEIMIGQHAGRRVFLPRIPLCPSDNDMFPFKFKRKQFPVRLSFAMTINKAQGQMIPVVGVYLPNPVFSHGQLYVALSRATTKINIKILIEKEREKENGKKQSSKSKKRKRPTLPLQTSMKNIVYKEVLRG
ncbi:uncharacterized protein [Aegilops tauschii subsp. strangulata]|uniref:uncharacterized protein n=1 Tax=Aegilops tauschii subsp. strangulata TaxID=200361 RepID=UPI003CC8DBC1